MRKQLYRAAAATVLGLSLTTGVVAADTGNISNTGASSYNRVGTKATDNSVLTNNNSIGAHNENYQTARTGKVGSYRNTTATGTTSSGNATNGNTVSATLAVNNSASSAAGTGMTVPTTSDGTIDTTGANSQNTVSNTYTDNSRVTNNNTEYVHNTSSQSATSGDATVAANTTSGSAQSGNATNTASSTFNFSVTN